MENENVGRPKVDAVPKPSRRSRRCAAAETRRKYAAEKGEMSRGRQNRGYSTSLREKSKTHAEVLRWWRAGGSRALVMTKKAEAGL